MKYLPLLQKSLKSDEIMDLLELYEIDVTYDFDRLHENMPDKYWASFHDLGIQMMFDENQILNTIFIFLIPNDEFAPAEISDSDILEFESKQAVRDYAEQNQISTTEGQTTFLGKESDWIRFDYPDYRVHYDFGGGQLKDISLTIT